MPEREYSLRPIGVVRRAKNGPLILIDEPYRAGLSGLDQFSHVVVLWWADRHDNPQARSALRCEPPYARGHTMGVFATRAEYRPNPVAITVCKIAGVDEVSGSVRIGEIDALDGTPVIDLKAYFPVCERVRNASIPPWLAGWPEWWPEEGLGL